MLNSSRKRRIAAGSGTQVVDINRLLKQFEMMQAMTKQFAGGKMPKSCLLYTSAEGDAAGDGAALHKQLGEGGVGQVIPLPAQHGFQITQKLSLQHALSVPVPLRPAQLLSLIHI